MTVFKANLPEWIIKIKGKQNEFLVDPDLFYPQFLDELGITEVTQYWLEVCMGIMKFDFDMHVGLTGAPAHGRIIRYVRADDGRKYRWNNTMYPVGHKNWDKMTLTERVTAIREQYKNIRGFVPSG